LKGKVRLEESQKGDEGNRDANVHDFPVRRTNLSKVTAVAHEKVDVKKP